MVRRLGRRCSSCVALAVGLAGAAFGQQLNPAVQDLIARGKLGDARIGVSIIDCESGEVLANVGADQAMTPASNMKLLTSGTALLVLGPDFTFRTEFIMDGDRLIVRGGGDPALGDPVLLGRMTPKMAPGEVVAQLVEAAKKAGITRVSQVVVDDRVFDRDRVNPNWPQDQLDRGYCAEVAGVNFHANVLGVYPRPSRDGAGRPALYTLEPESPWVKIDVSARTVTQGQNSAWVRRTGEGNQFELLGDVRTGTQVPVEVTIRDVPAFFGRVLANELVKAGIGVAGATTPGGIGDDAVRVPGPREELGGGAAFAVVTTPMPDIMQRCNSDSENLYAESLMKRMGYAVTKSPGSWENGSAVLRMTLTDKLGPTATASTVVTDGSGLSKLDAVAPANLTRWLSIMAKDPRVGAAFTASLAEPGMGTLTHRFREGKLENQLRAKSGKINFVRTLSGYVINERTGRRVAFSVMCNDLRNDAAGLALHESVVRLADDWLSDRCKEQPKSGG